MKVRQKVTTFLWFDSQAEDAAQHYVSIFPDSQIVSRTPSPDGGVMLVEFVLAGTRFLALNGGPHYQLSPAVSLSVECDDQAELDRYWNQLAEGGSDFKCGWLKDRFGLSWQIIPSILPTLLATPGKAPAVMQTLLQMEKLEIQPLLDAAATD
ncbi:MAG: VOC family protein [Planctomycetaceae bacterium]|nr:VOC family protein [Planctomycetaceae bacterium]